MRPPLRADTTRMDTSAYAELIGALPPALALLWLIWREQRHKEGGTE